MVGGGHTPPVEPDAASIDRRPPAVLGPDHVGDQDVGMQVWFGGGIEAVAESCRHEAGGRHEPALAAGPAARTFEPAEGVGAGPAMRSVHDVGGVARSEGGEERHRLGGREDQVPAPPAVRCAAVRQRETIAGPAAPKHRIEGRAADHPFEAEVAPAGAAPATCYCSIEVVAPSFLAEPVHDQHPNGGGGRRGAATKPCNIMKYYRIAVRRASVSPGQQPARQPRAGGFLLQLRRPRRAVLCAVSATSGSDGGPGRGCARRRHRRPADLDQFDHRCADRRPGLGHDQSRASAVRGEKPDRP